jgi:hypothetical protein
VFAAEKLGFTVDEAAELYREMLLSNARVEAGP